MSKRDPLEGAATPAAAQPQSFDEAVRVRQRSRAIVTGLALAAFAILLFAITIVRIGGQ